MASTFKSMVKRLFFILAVSFLLIGPAVCAEKVYYSIQFATLQDLGDVNKQVNLLKEKAKIVFWEKTEGPAVGQFYRVYVGRYKNWDDAAAFRQKLINDGAAGHLGIQWFSEAVEPEWVQEPPKLIVSKKPTFVRPEPSAQDKDRFIDNNDGTVTDTKTNLMWIKNGWRLEFIAASSWFDAMDKVKNFKYATFNDWRLPTIEEWNSLIDTNHKNPALVEPNPFENMISHMPYWSKTEFTYDKNHTCNKECPFDSYIVTLWSGLTYHQKKSDRAFILPVRSMVTQKSNKK